MLPACCVLCDGRVAHEGGACCWSLNQMICLSEPDLGCWTDLVYSEPLCQSLTCMCIVQL